MLVAVESLFALMKAGPYHPAGEANASEGGRQVHEADKPLMQVFRVLDAGPLGAEVKESHQPEFQLEGVKMGRDGNPRYTPPVWRFKHGPAPPLTELTPVRCNQPLAGHRRVTLLLPFPISPDLPSPVRTDGRI